MWGRWDARSHSEGCTEQLSNQPQHTVALPTHHRASPLQRQNGWSSLVHRRLGLKLGCPSAPHIPSLLAATGIRCPGARTLGRRTLPMALINR